MNQIHADDIELGDWIAVADRLTKLRQWTRVVEWNVITTSFEKSAPLIERSSRDVTQGQRVRSFSLSGTVNILRSRTELQLEIAESRLFIRHHN